MPTHPGSSQDHLYYLYATQPFATSQHPPVYYLLPTIQLPDYPTIRLPDYPTTRLSNYLLPTFLTAAQPALSFFFTGGRRSANSSSTITPYTSGRTMSPCRRKRSPFLAWA